MHFCSIFVTIFAACFNIVACLDSNELNTLRLVISLFRHGDRNPSSTFKTDVNNSESTWQDGFGELTKLGIQQEYELGQYIKERYKGFLSEDYVPKEIYIRTTSYNRTIMSAMAKMAGMYPPKGHHRIWNEKLQWQPIPIHSRPRENDPVLWMDKPCPTVYEIYKNRVRKLDRYLKIENENAEFLEYLSQKIGRSDRLPLIDAWDVWDPLHCEAIHNDTHSWPDWVTQEIFDKIQELYRLSVSFYYNLPEVQYFRGALLFNEVASTFRNKVDKNSRFIRNLKYYGYSLHDTTQVAFLENLRAYDGSISTYAQTLLLELHDINGTYIIKLYKKNDTNEIYSLPIPICGNPCLYDKFYNMSLVNKPENWEEECRHPHPDKKNETSHEEESLLKSLLRNDPEEILFSAGVVLGFVILILAVFFIVTRTYLKVRRSN